MDTNTFLQPVDTLAFGSYVTTDVLAALDITEALAWERLNELLGIDAASRTFPNTVLALTRSTDEFDAACSIVSHLESVLGEPWRASDELANERATKLGSDINFNTDLYAAMVSYREHGSDRAGLDGPQLKLLDDIIRGYKRSGITLPADKIERLKVIKLELSALTTKFGQNVVIASDAAVLWLEEGALDGLAESFIADCQAAAKADGKSGYKLSYSQPVYGRLMTECRIAATRASMYELHNRLAATRNETVAKDILKLRRELAVILGYRDYADYALEERMAKSGAIAATFIHELADRYRTQAGTERDTLQEFAREYEHNPELKLAAPDLDTGLDLYYADKLRERQIGLSEQSLRPYFQLSNVLDQMFTTLGKLYGVRFTAIQQAGWHDDVEVYEIYDEANHHIATVWCDWLARRGKKPGAWMNQHYVAERAGGNFDRAHLGYVCANFAPAENDQPVLLSLRDVETVWHEFGHFMHAALGRTELPEHAALHCRWDFVEAPSQIMENWVWVPEVLRTMAIHYQTGESLPSEVMHKLVASRRFNVATKAMRQFSFAACDLAAHIEYDPTSEVGLSDYIRPIKQAYLAVPTLPNDAGMTSFSHIFAGGYAAAYYSYKWAEAIETDLFSRFASDGPLNEATGHEYRDKVLARGSEVEPTELIEAFLGRPSNSDALLKRDGIPL